MLRFLGLLFLVAAALRTYFDWQSATNANETFVFQPIGQVWFDFNSNSLLALQPAIERYLSPVIWEKIIGPMLLWPMAPTLFGAAIVFGLLSMLFKRRDL